MLDTQNSSVGAGRKVAVGLSGGVDSSLSAHLLVEAGYDVTGVYLECWRAPGCRTEEDRKDALAVALQLNIPLKVLDLKQTYKDKVVEYFFQEYQAGRTPNPDVMCNKEVKFGLFYDWAMNNGFEFMATGHYAQIFTQPALPALSETQYLASSVDTHKDQTYFLYLLREEQLSHILFPIGHLTKDQVRAEARKRSIPVADKKDSVGICFIGDINVHEFLAERLGKQPGPVIDTSGNIIGEHQGLWFYTVGQRQGFTIYPKTLVRRTDGNIIDKHNIPPFYVIGKNAPQNQLIVGFGAETYQSQFTVTDLHWINSETSRTAFPQQCSVRIRHTGKLIGCTLTQQDSKTIMVQLNEPIQGLAQGQSAVFYIPAPHFDPNQLLYLCLGGGVIV